MHTCLQYISMRNEINQPEQETSTKFELFPAFSLFTLLNGQDLNLKQEHKHQITPIKHIQL